MNISHRGLSGLGCPSNKHGAEFIKYFRSYFRLFAYLGRILDNQKITLTFFKIVN